MVPSEDSDKSQNLVKLKCCEHFTTPMSINAYKGFTPSRQTLAYCSFKAVPPMTKSFAGKFHGTHTS